jgi:hypothetical protein
MRIFELAHFSVKRHYWLCSHGVAAEMPEKGDG